MHEEKVEWVFKAARSWRKRCPFSERELRSMIFEIVIKADESYDSDYNIDIWRRQHVRWGINTEMQKLYNKGITGTGSGMKVCDVALTDDYVASDDVEVYWIHTTVHDFLMGLKPMARKICELWACGYTPTEIGRFLGKSRDAVRNSLVRNLPHYSMVNGSCCSAGGHPKGRYSTYPETRQCRHCCTQRMRNRSQDAKRQAAGANASSGMEPYDAI